MSEPNGLTIDRLEEQHLEYVLENIDVGEEVLIGWSTPQSDTNQHHRGEVLDVDEFQDHNWRDDGTPFITISGEGDTGSSTDRDCRVHSSYGGVVESVTYPDKVDGYEDAGGWGSRNTRRLGDLTSLERISANRDGDDEEGDDE